MNFSLRGALMRGVGLSMLWDVSDRNRRVVTRSGRAFEGKDLLCQRIPWSNQIVPLTHNTQK
jgi:hypothetical protein